MSSKPRSGHKDRRAVDHRLKRMRAEGLKKPIGPNSSNLPATANREVAIDCGWGRLLFAQTFENQIDLVDALRSEKNKTRDIAFYIRDPHVALATAPQEIFLDPSHTYRLDLATYRTGKPKRQSFFVRRLCSESDAHAVNRIYSSHDMVTVNPEFFWRLRDSRTLTFLVAEDEASGEIIGAVTGVDHERAFQDPEKGSSLWCLSVDPKATHPGIGEGLVRRLAETFHARGCSYMDLSVLHDNELAIQLYEKLGFKRVPFFTLKRKNPINEKLFVGNAPDEALNPYARIITNEARRRGIDVEVLDAEGGFFKLRYGGRSLTCRESLSELTSAVAMSRCDDKSVTRRLMQSAGVPVPEQVSGDDLKSAKSLLKSKKSVVVKPTRGEQGRGVVVGVTSLDALKAAIKAAREICPDVLVEECVTGGDLRVLVIEGKVVAAALRKPPVITGDGQRSILELIESLSRRRQASTGGESSIPLDEETERCVQTSDHAMSDILPKGEKLTVRKTANLHTGGALYDVTDKLHPTIAESAIKAVDAIEIPVCGIDFIVKDPGAPDHVFIEANERPGLANHEPQPTAERFVDLLFPLSSQRSRSKENKT